MRQEMRALGLGLLGIAAACGSTSQQGPTAAAGCGGLDATSGSASIAAATSGGTASGGTTAGAATTGGSPGSLPEPDPAGGVAGDNGGAVSGTSGAGGEGGDPDAGKTLISGVVVGDDELPVAGAVVLAQGRRVASGADGSFQLHLTIPYDLALLEPPLEAADQPSIGEPHGYLGLARTQIKLYVRTLQSRTTHISGSVSGRLPTPEPTVGLVYGHSPQRLGDAAVDASGHFSLSAPPWHGDAPLRAMLLVAQADPAPDGVAPHLNSLATRAILLDPSVNLGSPATDVTLAK